MVTMLPPNILAYLATHVYKYDWRNCALVCKQWTEPFLNAYWAQVYFGGYMLNKLFDKFGLKEVYQWNAHRTWALNIRLFTKDLKYILVLQQTYSRIKYLIYLIYDEDIFAVKTDWSLWKTLSHLELDFRKVELTIDEFLEQLSPLTCLVHLTICQYNDNINRPDTSLTDMESIHSYFPHLQYININTLFKPISEKEIETIRNVEPAHTVTKIVLYFPYIDPSWIFYFAHKYPNLVTCNLRSHELKPRFYLPPYDQKKYQIQPQLLLSSKQFFPCLQTANIIVHDNNYWLFYLFYDTLQRCNVKIKHATIKFNENMSKENGLNSWIKYLSESVISLNIYSSCCNQSIPVETNPVVLYKNLTVLKILVCPRVDMEIILNYCPVLQSLYITNSMIHSPEYPLSMHVPHPLQRLEIEMAQTSVSVFKYISFRCRQLKYMKLKNIFYKPSDMNETGQILVDMSFSQLKVLKTSESEIDDPEDIYGIISPFFLHIVIEQIGNVGTDQVQAPRSNWYHLCVDKTNRKSRLLAWELGRRDIEFCQRYLKDFKRRKGREKKRKDMKRSSYNYKLKRFWKRDLQHGVLIFRLKSVETYFLYEKNADNLILYSKPESEPEPE
ncbi:hypothetical protein PHYBLDRAFT_72572 [Phycomyces blakesleeanus NRRL 1555(-)]|uniref:F-box domain-containing protein n=1 Tax=Phycomyces blakesleeanus (strain ATCC 8743b / DSM 1359 / FGSC 10004 / NBRC 33097 / NRRL 1555) TaxID=763407 RepID=A0A162Z9N5_PHYB8|nr:hypothetical protein PHYBLDRAFT_72572 [Phycomyces blakesleeanus NRRL 1555(-)]OAD65251.1 hypothetical protein PHYBLDRAFT_72572 [Phycomyces blakesleeanus NRRL 1555(-)]|eukprot:XP_018283291.1 hypothetical protein PHYBLDRAFT_72572 [Phycomyces blakesleeanus NRRL 1555(-)]